MIDYSRANLEWLGELFQLTHEDYRLEAGDATNYQWKPPVNIVAGETYLGRRVTTSMAPTSNSG